MSRPFNPPSRASEAREKAHSYFAAHEHRTSSVKQMVEAESAALDARTARLRALRLAVEEAHSIEACNNPAPAIARPKAGKNVRA